MLRAYCSSNAKPHYASKRIKGFSILCPCQHSSFVRSLYDKCLYPSTTRTSVFWIGLGGSVSVCQFSRRSCFGSQLCNLEGGALEDKQPIGRVVLVNVIVLYFASNQKVYVL